MHSQPQCKVEVNCQLHASNQPKAVESVPLLGIEHHFLGHPGYNPLLYQASHPGCMIQRGDMYIKICCKTHFGNLGVDGRISKCILNKYDMKMCVRFIGIRKRSSSGLLWTQ
jgi:gamma-glutamyl:cysteine ligase YbdK (ATP-grasp superfamily)